MHFRTDRQRVQGLGASRDGVGHWWGQRITSIALVPLTIVFLFPFAQALGESWERVRAVYGHPFNAVAAILFLAVGFRHLQQGIQVVLEDYVHDKPLLVGLLLANTLLTLAFAITGIFAVALIAFGA
jgi:succinate dehydrogenase / fumarate reductase membrane anchor subunit